MAEEEEMDREEGSRDREMWVGVIDCAGTCTITRGWSHVSGLNSPFARYNGSDVAVGPDLITRGCLWQTEARGRVMRLYQKRLIQPRLMAAQECEFGDMPRNLI